MVSSLHIAWLCLSSLRRLFHRILHCDTLFMPFLCLSTFSFIFRHSSTFSSGFASIVIAILNFCYACFLLCSSVIGKYLTEISGRRPFPALNTSILYATFKSSTFDTLLGDSSSSRTDSKAIKKFTATRAALLRNKKKISTSRALLRSFSLERSWRELLGIHLNKLWLNESAKSCFPFFLPNFSSSYHVLSACVSCRTKVRTAIRLARKESETAEEKEKVCHFHSDSEQAQLGFYGVRTRVVV